jgi:hypothetical protein
MALYENYEVSRPLYSDQRIQNPVAQRDITCCSSIRLRSGFGNLCASSRELFPAFSWRHWGKPQNVSVRILGKPIEIRTSTSGCFISLLREQKRTLTQDSLLIFPGCSLLYFYSLSFLFLSAFLNRLTSRVHRGRSLSNWGSGRKGILLRESGPGRKEDAYHSIAVWGGGRTEREQL